MSELLNAKEAAHRLAPGSILLRAYFAERGLMPLGDITQHQIEEARVSFELEQTFRAMRNAGKPSPYLEQQKAKRQASRAKREAAKMRRTPAWADNEAIAAVYIEARRMTAITGIQHEVDHIVPLQGRLVSGLHVENNLQILTGSENARKCNRFEVEE
jgi:hypothetical protein